ncbi:MAG: DUF4079 family protein [Candidatus Binatia bacterium]
MLPYVHPVAAGFTLALFGYVGSLGFRARSDPRRARQHLERHARLAPIMFGLVLASWIAGFLSAWQLRSDLELAASVHFRIGVLIILVLSGGMLTSRWMHRPEMRVIHPWFGAVAMLLAAAQVFFGLQITP